MCRQLNVFNPTIDFTVVKTECLLDDTIWTCSMEQIWHTHIPQIISSGTVEYTSGAVIDKNEYLFESWRVQHQPSYRDQFVKLEKSANDNLQFDLRLYFLKKSITDRKSTRLNSSHQ